MAPKLIGKRRVSHVADLCTDEGAGLFAGLNVLRFFSYQWAETELRALLAKPRLVASPG